MWLNLIEETGLGSTGKTEETKRKMSNGQLGNTKRRGKLHTIEAKEKNRISHIGKKHSKETIEKMCGKGHPQSEKTKEKIRQSLIGQQHKVERVEKMKTTKLNKQMRWFNNGMNAMLFSIGSEPEGWILGRKINK